MPLGCPQHGRPSFGYCRADSGQCQHGDLQSGPGIPAELRVGEGWKQRAGRSFLALAEPRVWAERRAEGEQALWPWEHVLGSRSAPGAGREVCSLVPQPPQLHEGPSRSPSSHYCRKAGALLSLST